MHKQEICEFNQIHSQCRCPSPVKLVVPVTCNKPVRHRAIYEAAMAAEIDHEVTVESLLYQIESLSARHQPVALEASVELKQIAHDLREALDIHSEDK